MSIRLTCLARRRVAMAALAWTAAAALARGYVPQGRCDVFERVDIASPPGTCVALVADEAQGLRMPRSIVEVAPGRFWITDMGSWEPRQGRLLELVLPPAGAQGPRRATVSVLARDLDRPHGLAIGPDNRIYVGEAGALWRTTVPPSGRSLTREPLIDDLPADGAHPLKTLAFGPGNVLYMNIGSATDACRNDAQQQPYPCPEVSGSQPRAAVYAVQLGGPALAPSAARPFATGLRNSLALAVLPDGTLLQGENNIDYPQPDQPPEELNRLRRGLNYGWPYCVGNRTAARGYEKRHDCARSEPPLQLWPAHAAPLAMLAGPRGGPWADRLLVAWHGPRAGGAQVVTIALDKTGGRPSGPPQALLHGWEAKPGVRPNGKPAGLAIDRQGRLLVVDDLNRSVLLLLPDAPSQPSR